MTKKPSQSVRQLSEDLIRLISASEISYFQQFPDFLSAFLDLALIRLSVASCVQPIFFSSPFSAGWAFRTIPQGKYAKWYSVWLDGFGSFLKNIICKRRDMSLLLFRNFLRQVLSCNLKIYSYNIKLIYSLELLFNRELERTKTFLNHSSFHSG